ncbi:unnamed protein product [Lactuca virosa]|uniref:Uncharacterized protein n=1 Tax=Lactuca virosa TaxID=75947 RepID=A0AAU9N8H3_9ASTR|nr:unnamed protein product [Lactuca virosa]
MAKWEIRADCRLEKWRLTRYGRDRLRLRVCDFSHSHPRRGRQGDGPHLTFPVTAADALPPATSFHRSSFFSNHDSRESTVSSSLDSSYSCIRSVTSHPLITGNIFQCQ